MESIVLEGKLIQMLQLQEGVSTRGAWKKQEFILETNEQYPKKVCISCWGEKVDDIQSFSSGDSLKVWVNIESREYNSRWYTDIKAWRIEANIPQDNSAASPTTDSEDDILGVSFSDEEDELPF